MGINLKEAGKKYINLTTERMPQVEPIPKFEAYSFNNKKGRYPLRNSIFN